MSNTTPRQLDLPFPSNIPAIRIMQDYGISLSNARNLVYGIWKLPDDQQDFLWNYYLLKWDSEFFLTSISDSGTITVQGRTYHVHYHRCNPASIKDYKSVWLSLRVWQQGLKQPNVALVKPAHQVNIIGD